MQAKARTTALGMVFGLALLYAAPSPAAAVKEVFAPYADLLQRHVVEHELAAGGLVSSFDYEAAIADSDSRGLIDRQRQRLADLEDDEFESREAALAFWINAYNFFMIAHLVDNPENGQAVGSVKDFGSLFNPFSVFDRKLFEVAGTMRALSEIELEILLGETFAERDWKDARVHFAVNCASVGCPPLRDVAYTESNVEALLDENTRRALVTPLHLKIEDNTARLTSLFDWYESDFEQDAGSIEAFIKNHVDPTRAARFEAAERIDFMDYDWQLNSPANIRQWLENPQ